jgi:hypothetical protein
MNYPNVELLNKLIKEELESIFKEAEDEIKVTTDEPEAGGEALDILKQIYDLIKPEVEGEEEMPEMGGEEGGEEEEGEEEEGEEEEGEEEEEAKNEVVSEGLMDVLKAIQDFLDAGGSDIVNKATSDAGAIMSFLAGVVGLIGTGALLTPEFRELMIQKLKDNTFINLFKRDPKMAAKNLANDYEGKKGSETNESTNSLNESADFQNRMKKLANIRG